MAGQKGKEQWLKEMLNKAMGNKVDNLPWHIDKVIK